MRRRRAAWLAGAPGLRRVALGLQSERPFPFQGRMLAWRLSLIVDRFVVTVVFADTRSGAFNLFPPFCPTLDSLVVTLALVR